MMTIEEAARELRVTPGMVQGCIRSRKLPHFSLTDDGKTVRIIRCDLRSYALRNKWEHRRLQVAAAVVAAVSTVLIRLRRNR